MSRARKRVSKFLNFDAKLLQKLELFDLTVNEVFLYTLLAFRKHMSQKILSNTIVRRQPSCFPLLVQINKVRSPEQMIFLELFFRTENFLAIKLNWPIEKTFFIIAQIELENYK